jgi:hypothetical protein
MTPRMLTVMLFAILAVAPAAEAECAWVLWQNHATVDKGVARHIVVNWEPGQAFETKKACEEHKGHEQFAARDERKEAWLFRCLPDTVDPRGPKGGGR